MKRIRFTEEQIIGVLREAEAGAKAAEHGLAVFGEHTADARNRSGAHPNVDRLLAIAAGGAPLSIEVIAAGR